MNPTADDVAIAVFAACRETGDDPIRTLEGGLGNGQATNRARHYALHALVHVFPKAGRLDLCRYVGCPGKPGPYWNSSWHQVAKPRFHGAMTHAAKWFDDAAYDRVIRAIEAGRTRCAVAPPPLPKPEPLPYRPPPGTVEKVLNGGIMPRNLGRLEPDGYRPPATAIADELAEDDPVFDRGVFRERKPRNYPAASSKTQLQDELRRAVENTARMQKPDV